MTEGSNRIFFAEFSENLIRIFDHIIGEDRSVVIEGGEGKLVEVKPVTSTKPERMMVTKGDDEAFLSAAARLPLLWGMPTVLPVSWRPRIGRLQTQLRRAGLKRARNLKGIAL